MNRDCIFLQNWVGARPSCTGWAAVTSSTCGSTRNISAASRSTRSSLLRVDRLAAEIFLVEPHVEDVTAAQPVHEGRAPTQFCKKMQSRFIEHRDHFTKQNIHPALAF